MKYFIWSVALLFFVIVTLSVLSVLFLRLTPTVIQIASNKDHFCALTNTGGVWCWGRGAEYNSRNPGSTFVRSPVRILNISKASDIFVSHTYACAKIDHHLDCWKTKELAQSVTNGQLADIPLTRLSTSTDIAVHQSIGSYECALSDQGLVWCGNYTSIKDFFPTDTLSLENNYASRQIIDEAVDISLSSYQGCALKSDQTVWCWLYNTPHRSDLKRNAPGPVSGLNDVVKIDSGHGHHCALTKQGLMWCWGSNFYGQFGTDGTRSQDNTELQLVKLEGIRDISLGGDNSCAIDQDNMLWCWGRNDAYQLGEGTTGLETIPSTIDLVARTETINVSDLMTEPSGKERLPFRIFPEPISQVFVEDRVICVTTKESEVYCWGDNRIGEVGTGSDDDYVTAPHLIEFPMIYTQHETALSLSQKLTTAKLLFMGEDELRPYASSKLMTNPVLREDSIGIGELVKVIPPIPCPKQSVSYDIPSNQLQPNQLAQCTATLPQAAANETAVSEIRDCSNRFNRCGDLEYLDQTGIIIQTEKDACSLTAECVSGVWNVYQTSF